MSGRRKDLPAPDMSGTDTDAILRSRIDLGTPVGTTPTPAHTRPYTSGEQVRAGKGTPKRSGSRPDPSGMRRASIYVSEESIAALEAAADQILALLGDGTPRHVALSALLQAGAEQAGPVAKTLAQQRAADLAARLAKLSTPE